jgi:hypothetical protein
LMPRETIMVYPPMSSYQPHAWGPTRALGTAMDP